MQNTRTEAIFILSRWLINREFPDRLIEEGTDHAFIMDMTYTTIRRYGSLMWALERFLKKIPRGETLAALLLGSAQLLFMDDVADHAAVNETVEAAKLRSKKSAALINGVLRNIIRSRDKLLAELTKQPLHIRQSHPEALIKRWRQRYTAEQLEKLCDWNNTPSETFMAGKPDKRGKTVFTKAPRGKSVRSIPGFSDGEFIVQDPATAAAIELLDLKPGLKTLDACAAPGGKTIQIAWRIGNPPAAGSKVVAVEPREDRIDTIRENLKRAKLEWVEIERANLTQASHGIAEKHGLFERVLLDLPCSNSGVLRRRPDARWRWSEGRVKKLIKTQRLILDHASKMLVPGGILVYSTCSLEPEENAVVIDDFLKNNPEFTIVKSIERTPFADETDGAFACALTRSIRADRQTREDI